MVRDLRRGPDPWFVCTGDTLFVGSVGRPDLPGNTRSQAAQLWTSLRQKLLSLPDNVEIFPAHFAGSACGAGLSGKPSSTIAFERTWNKTLSLGLESFVEELATQNLATPGDMTEMLRLNQGRA